MPFWFCFVRGGDRDIFHAAPGSLFMGPLLFTSSGIGFVANDCAKQKEECQTVWHYTEIIPQEIQFG